jgi:antirestriction protein ArdC
MRNAHKTSAQRRDHYQELTDKIIAALETGAALATTMGQDRRRRRDCARERSHRPSLSRH